MVTSKMLPRMWLIQAGIFLALVSGWQLPQERLVKAIRADTELDPARVDALLQCAEQALTTWRTTSPEFFVTPLQMLGITKAFKDIADVGVGYDGGYRLSERHRVFFSRQEEGVVTGGGELAVLAEDLDSYLAAVEVRGVFTFDKATHAEFVESIYTIPGIVQEKIGDVVVYGDRGCGVVVTPDQAQLLCSGITSVRSVPVEAVALQHVSQMQQNLRPPSRKELSLVEASDRLDAVASAGLCLSRSAMVKLIDAGHVLVNWRPARSAASPVRAKDVIMVRGVGRLVMEDVALTAKGRTRIKCMRIT